MKKLAILFIVGLICLCGCGAAGTDRRAEENTRTETGNAEETESETIEEKIIVKKRQECALEDGGLLILTILDVDGEETFYIDAAISGDERACVCFTYIYAVYLQDSMKKWHPGCSVQGNSGLVMYVDEKIRGTNRDGSSSEGMPDWYISNTDDYTMSKEERADLMKEIRSYMEEFLGEEITVDEDAL